MAKTVKPKGLQVKRSGNKFTFSWVCGDKNYSDGQQLWFRLNTGKNKWSTWTAISVTAGARSKAKVLDWASYYPTTYTDSKTGQTKTRPFLNAIQFRVRGNRGKYTKGKGKKQKTINPGWSAYSYYRYNIKTANVPTLTEALSEQFQTKAVFSWETAISTTTNQVFRGVLWQSILVENCQTVGQAKTEKWDSSNPGWETGTSTSGNSSQEITDDSFVISQGKSYARWFRIKSRGPKGNSDWAYIAHIYAEPNSPVITKAEMVELSSGATSVYVEWKSDTSQGARPILQTTVEYLIAKPRSGMLPPTGETWNPVMLPNDDFEGHAAQRFSINDQIGEDQCLFVHVVNQYDGYQGISDAVIPKGGVGPLKAPTLTNVVQDDTTFMATVTATNESEVTDSWLAIYYRELSKPSELQFIGVLDYGETTVDVQAPDWTGKTAQFGVQAFVGEKTQNTGAFVTYSIVGEPLMQSEIVWNNGLIPVAPTQVGATPLIVNGIGTIKVTWDWPWADATGAVIAWSDHEDAWMSTDAPEEYEVSQIHASEWNISGLETGKTWFVRVRLFKGTGDNKNYGAWSDIIPVGLKSAPTIPYMQLSDEVIRIDGTVEASWAYSTTDGTPQAQAEICTATFDNQGVIQYGSVIAKAGTAQHVTITAEQLGGTVGATYNLCVRVTSSSGETSDGWSDPVPVSIAEAVEITEVSKSLNEITITDDADLGLTSTVLALQEMPLTAQFSGAGEGGTTTIEITRLMDYPMRRPTDEEVVSFKGEIIAAKQIPGEGLVTIDLDEDVVGHLDDGGWYKMTATVQDTYGQTASLEYEFIVAWTVQAQMPEATARVEDGAVVITPIAPASPAEGDVVDIYRLSADKPELIYPNANFGTEIVDPYPALGEHGGHRIVYKTANGDYIIEGKTIAFTDLREAEDDYIYQRDGILDFDGYSVPVLLNVNFSTQWSKDFEEKRYLGGSIQGYWNPGTARSGSISTDVLHLTDEDTIEEMRRLADYDGPVHVRTIYGDSFWANVDVQIEENSDALHKWAAVSLSFNRIDPETYDGLLYSEWKEGQSE